MVETQLQIDREEEEFRLTWNPGTDDYEIVLSAEAFEQFARALDSAQSLAPGATTMFAFDVYDEEEF